MKRSVEHWWNNTDWEVFGEKPVPVTLRSPQIPQGLNLNGARRLTDLYPGCKSHPYPSTILGHCFNSRGYRTYWSQYSRGEEYLRTFFARSALRNRKRVCDVIRYISWRCLQTNHEMGPDIASCHYKLLIQPS
jgi:hypothetical protein